MRPLMLALALALGCDSNETDAPTAPDLADAADTDLADAADTTWPADAADTDLADATDTTWPPDTAWCHTDCFGGATCANNIVRRLGYGPKPCELGPGCETGETYTCQTACRAFASLEAMPDPYDQDLPLSEYCEGENVLPVGDWLSPCEPGSIAPSGSGAAASTSCEGGVCLYATLATCRFTGCANSCVTDRGCPTGGRCNGDGVCEPGDPTTRAIEPPADFSCPADR